jgi:hypothetical protein
MAAGAVRADLVTDDLGFMFEMIATVRRRSGSHRAAAQPLSHPADGRGASALRPHPLARATPTFGELVERFQTGGQLV